MSVPGIAGILTGLYAGLALLLLSLHLKSAWRWPIKASATLLALPAAVGTFLAVEAETGWPSAGSPPARFQLHAALIEEPDAGAEREGAIFLWLTPWVDVLSPAAVQADEAAEEEILTLVSLRPRAFTLPYSRELHRKVETMRERLAKGELVTGSHQVHPGWQRRFGEQDGVIDLDAPPPPPLPAKG